MGHLMEGGQFGTDSRTLAAYYDHGRARGEPIRGVPDGVALTSADRGYCSVSLALLGQRTSEVG
jgi:hypothetical protein